MSRTCQITGIRPMVGHLISHSNIKTKRKFMPNLTKRRFFVPEAKKWVVLKVSNAGLKTIDKNGISACLKKSYSKGLLPKKVLELLGKKFLQN